MKYRRKVSEAILQEHCVQYFAKMGYLVREEVPFLLKVVDLFCFHEQTGECVAVEVKVKNWRRALEQAMVYQMMADRVYVALHDTRITSVDRSLVRSKGIGLLEVSLSGDVNVVMEAPKSARRIDHFVSRTLTTAFPEVSSVACLLV